MLGLRLINFGILNLFGNFNEQIRSCSSLMSIKVYELPSPLYVLMIEVNLIVILGLDDLL